MLELDEGKPSRPVLRAGDGSNPASLTRRRSVFFLGLPLQEAMTKRADPETPQRKHWRKALSIALILFEEYCYHPAYLSEIQAFIETTTANTLPMQTNGAAEPPPPAPAERLPDSNRAKKSAKASS